MKTLVEQLREMVKMANENETCPAVFATPIVGHAVSTREDDIELFTTIADRIEREYIPMPLDADGVPIKLGDVVYATHYQNIECTALSIEWLSDGWLVEVENRTGHKFQQTPDEFTHKQHDTLERIEADARKMFTDYWGCGDAECYCCPVMVDGKRPHDRYGNSIDSCFIAQKLDLLRRQREVLEREQA